MSSTSIELILLRAYDLLGFYYFDLSDLIFVFFLDFFLIFNVLLFFFLHFFPLPNPPVFLFVYSSSIVTHIQVRARLCWPSTKGFKGQSLNHLQTIQLFFFCSLLFHFVFQTLSRYYYYYLVGPGLDLFSSTITFALSFSERLV